MLGLQAYFVGKCAVFLAFTGSLYCDAICCGSKERCKLGTARLNYDGYQGEAVGAYRWKNCSPNKAISAQ
jgi:hypothetical protein